MMKDNWIKYARTFVPALAGFILAALSGIDIEVDSAALETVLDGVVVGAATLIYYGAVNLASRVKPQLQVLNGAPAQPTYDEVIAGLTGG